MLPPASNKSLLKHVTLIGMAGVGKSTIGRIVARQMNTDLHDSDNDIELKCQASIAEIFARHGEEYFRTQEYETIASYFDGPPAIIATGGGAWIQPQLRALCQDHALNIWLKADIETLWENTKNRTHRPLLQGENP
ncbi:MAG: shikimate kinase, partial [Pseudomonadota bacterium]